MIPTWRQMDNEQEAKRLLKKIEELFARLAAEPEPPLLDVFGNKAFFNLE